jgi:hypothetical protein
MNISKTTTVFAAVMVAAGTGSTATAFADEAAPVTTSQIGSPAKLENGGVVQTWTIGDLKPSTDTIPYQAHGTLWEATATDEAVEGSVTPIVSNLNARTADGQNYRVLFEVATPQGVNPATLTEGQKTTGKIYFDVTGDKPTSVVYSSGGGDLAVWTHPASPAKVPAATQPAPARTQPAPAAVAAPTTPVPAAAPTAAPAPTAGPAATPAPAPAGAGNRATDLPTGSQGTPVPGGSQGTPLPAGSQGTPVTEGTPAQPGAPVPANAPAAPAPAAPGGSQGTPLPEGPVPAPGNQGTPPPSGSAPTTTVPAGVQAPLTAGTLPTLVPADSQGAPTP